jgi:hypothetical protein
VVTAVETAVAAVGKHSFVSQKLPLFRGSFCYAHKKDFQSCSA